MANHPSALKRDRQRRKKQTRNRSVRSVVKKVLKDARAALPTDKAVEAVREASSALARAAQKGALSKRTASRRIGRLARALQRAQIAATAAPATDRPSKAPKRATKAPKKAAAKPTKAAAAAKAPAKRAKKST